MATFTKIGGGSSGGVTFPDGSVQTTALSSSYGGIGGRAGQVFSSTGNFTVPTGITKVKVTCIGAGGGGAGAIDSSNSVDIGGSGGSGGCAIKFVTNLTPGAVIPVTIGQGGSGGGRSNGTSGGNSSFGSYCIATGGGGGQFAGSGGGGGSATVYDLVIGGGGGSPGSVGGVNPQWPTYGQGGESGYGRGNESYTTVGKPGANGFVFVEW